MILDYRAATANFWRGTTAAAAFYSSKSRQGLGLGGLASRGGPGLINNIVHSFESQCEQKIST